MGPATLTAVHLVDAHDRGGGRRHVDLLAAAWSRSYAPVRLRLLSAGGLGDLSALTRSVIGLHADLIHSHSRRTGFLGRLIGRTTGIPVVHTYHGLHPERWGRAWTWLERRLQRWTAATVHVSWSQADFAERIGLPGQVIPNGLDHAKVQAALRKALSRAQLGLPTDKVVVGCFGRLDDPVKGLNRLLDAGAVFIHYLLIGGRVTAPNVTCIPWTAEPLHYLPACDLYAAPSDAEGMPYAVMEAMAAGIPIVATAVRGHTDLVSSDNGWLASLERFGDALRNACLAGPVERARRGAYGRQRIHAFTSERTAEQLVELYRRIA